MPMQHINPIGNIIIGRLVFAYIVTGMYCIIYFCSHFFPLFFFSFQIFFLMFFFFLEGLLDILQTSTMFQITQQIIHTTNMSLKKD